jgi:hypothetical protein
MVEPKAALTDLPIISLPSFFLISVLVIDWLTSDDVDLLSSFEIFNWSYARPGVMDPRFDRLEPLRVSQLVLEQIFKLSCCESVGGYTEKFSHLKSSREGWLPKAGAPFGEGRLAQTQHLGGLTGRQVVNPQEPTQIIRKALHPTFHVVHHRQTASHPSWTHG